METVNDRYLFGRSLKRSVIAEAAFFLATMIFTVVCFYVFKPKLINEGVVYKRGSSAITGATAQYFEVFLLAILAAVAFILYRSKKLNVRTVVILLLAAGVIIRVCYMLRTPAGARQYDTFSPHTDGHEGYARTIYETGALPTTNSYQFYHPPLNAFVQSVFMRINSFLVKIFNPESTADGSFYATFSAGKPGSYLTDEQYFLFGTCQILSALYSVVVALTSVKILKLLGLEGKTFVFAAAIVIFFPRTIQFSAMLNNDSLALMNSVLALYFALRWWKGKRSWTDILLCGLFLGLGMMTKLSSATVCLPIAAVFVYEFVIAAIKRGYAAPIGKLVLQYGAFLLICAPLGLWFQIYAYKRFAQPFGYVFPYLNPALGTSDVSLFERLFITFDKNELIGSLFIRNFKNYSAGINNNYNLFNYSVRSAIFGEFGYWEGEAFAVAALLLGLIFCAVATVGCVVAIVAFIRKDRKPFTEKDRVDILNVCFVAALIASQVLSLVAFYIKMPYSCTMDFRYVMPLILGIALSSAMSVRTLYGGGKIKRILADVTVFTECAFLAVSCAFYFSCI